jgi:Flp pilus assembly protein TadD
MSADTPESVVWHLIRCDGFLDLRLWDRARGELAQVPLEHRERTAYRQLDLRLAIETRNWPQAVEQARQLCEQTPKHAGFWIQHAYAARRAIGIAEARSILLEALKRFPAEATISYNLACYECQLGHREQALAYLQRAEKLQPSCRVMALEDDDLKPLWPELGTG